MQIQTIQMLADGYDDDDCDDDDDDFRQIENNRRVPVPRKCGTILIA
jgi:hypothetical protein